MYNKKISNVMLFSILKHMRKVNERCELKSCQRVQEARRKLGGGRPFLLLRECRG